MPALFGDATIESDSDIVTAFATAQTNAIVTQGRQLGLAIAAIDEVPASPACRLRVTGGAPKRDRPPLVIDLSALWAGPLAGHLLGLAGAQVVKVESRNRSDRMREGDPMLFARLNQHKANVAIDLRDTEDRAALIALIRRADMVIAAARPRALAQLGIDADALVRDVPGLVWVTITGHGADGDAAHWIGFGDDCSVAGD
ncbi:CoA transferase [Sphingobium scionense]